MEERLVAVGAGTTSRILGLSCATASVVVDVLMARRRTSSRSAPVRSLLGRRWFFRINVVIALFLGGWYWVQPETRQQEVRRLVGAAMARDKQVSALDVASDIWQLYYANPATGRMAEGDKTHVYGGVPRGAAESSLGSLRVLTNRGYVVGYDDARASAVWAAYRVRDLAKIPEPPPRPDKFVIDRRTAARISPDVYSGSGYDRGHLAPNYAIATQHGAAAQLETFLMSNIVPQRHALNAGLWRELEQKIATNYPARYAEVWIYVGPVFGARPKELRAGVPIPEAFFLIAIDEHEGKLRTLSAIVPQEAPANADVVEYLTSIDEIERRTKLDFLAELDDISERSLESARPPHVW